jgi:hypothetical protein
VTTAKRPVGRPFVKGNPGGPGRPKRAVEERYLVALQDGVKDADWKAIVVRAVVDAKKGDAPARAWLSKYLLPDPAADAGEKVGGGLQALVDALSARDPTADAE